FLPIWIGHPEAAAILMKLQSQAPPRPMTHDLLSDMLEQLGAQVIRITVTELRENTFYAQITVQQDGTEIEVDSRPSDAIALPIRSRRYASAIPKGTSTMSASTSPCHSPNATPTSTIDGQRPRKPSRDCPTPRNVSSSMIGATIANSTQFAANAPACAGSQFV